MDDLLLLSGNDIPFIKAQIVIHQPTVKEIAFLGEETFFTGCELLNFSKNILPEQDKMLLGDQTNFDILIAILREQNAVMQKNRNCVESLLALLFPDYNISFKKEYISLEKENEDEHIINNDNFEDFKNIVNTMFSYKKNSSSDLNPSGDLAKRIAEKLKKRHQKLSEVKPQAETKIDIISRYVSILAVGLQKNINDLLQYTIYQLFDEFKRFELKISYDIYFQAKMAGAKDLKEVEDWMKNIHS